jgi:hypothetical protein
MLDFGNEVIHGASLLTSGIRSGVTVVEESEMGSSDAKVTLYVCFWYVVFGMTKSKQLVPPSVSVEEMSRVGQFRGFLLLLSSCAF